MLEPMDQIMAQSKRRAAKAPSIDVGPGASRGDRTRQLIVKAIAKLASRKEVGEITLVDICTATKLTTGAVYFHFGGRDEAIEAMVIDEVQALYESRYDRYATSFDPMVSALIANSAAYHKRKRLLPRAIVAIINSRPDAYRAWLAARQPLVAQLTELIVDKRSRFRLSLQPAVYLAHFILNSIEDLGMDLFQWKNPTLAQFSGPNGEWVKNQTALWGWAVLAPFPTVDKIDIDAQLTAMLGSVHQPARTTFAVSRKA